MSIKINKTMQNCWAFALVASLSACGGGASSSSTTEELPSVVGPEVVEPSDSEPDVSEPDVSEPDVSEPDVSEPDVSEPDVGEPDVSEPDVSEPDVSEPEIIALTAVRNLKATPSDQEISLTFSSKQGASQYEVFITTQINTSLDCAEENNECRSVLIADNQVILNSLDNSQQYFLWVRALDGKGNPGDVSEVINLSPDQYADASNTHNITLEQELTKLSKKGEVLASTAGNWQCVFDNNSKLVWEVKHNEAEFSMRYPGHVGHKYAWKNTDASTNLGHAGADTPVLRSGSDSSVLCDNNGSDALLACNTEAYAQLFNSEAVCGFDDWRLPTPKELQTIISYTSNDLFDLDYFPLANAQQNQLWTSASVQDKPENAVIMYGKEFVNGYSKSESAIGIRLVRGNPKQASPIFRFLFPRGDYDLVNDVITGLQWRICAEGTDRRETSLLSDDGARGTYCIDGLKNDFYGELTDVDGYYQFDEAVAKQKSGWRLPTLAELKTLVAEEQNVEGTFYADPFVFPNAAISSGEVDYQRNQFVPEENRNEFWSSTVDPEDPNKVYIIDFTTGEIIKRNKAYYARARFVK